MTEEEREFKIGSITLSFREFIYGYKRLVRVAKSEKSTKNKVLFYQHAIYNYIAEYFLIENPMVFVLLKETGLEDLGEPIKNTINTKVGNTSFGEVIRRIRNKAIVHEGYSSKNIHQIFLDANMYSESGHLELAKTSNILYREVVKLQRKLLKLLPKDAGY